MSLSKSEQRLPQFCARHSVYSPGKPNGPFPAKMGCFIDNRSRWVCRDCRRQERRLVRDKKGRSESPVEETIANLLRRYHIEFEQQAKLGKYRTDFLLPRKKIRLEIDSTRWHKGKPSKPKERLGHQDGYRVIHVRTGRALEERVIAALCAPPPVVTA